MYESSNNLINALGSYFIYLCALLISLLSGETNSLDLLPTVVDAIMAEHSHEVVVVEKAFELNDGHLELLGMAFTDILQIIILIMTIFFTLLKGTIDIKNYFFPERRIMIWRKWRNDRRD